MKPSDDEYNQPDQEESGNSFPEEVAQEDEDTSAYSSGPQKPNLVNLLKNRRFWVPVGLAVAIYIVYKFFSGSVGVSTKPQQPSNSQAVQPIQKSLSTAAKTPATPSTSVLDATSAPSLEQAQAGNQEAFKQLRNSLKRLQANQAQLSDEITKLSQSLQALSEVVEKMVEQQVAQKKTNVKKKPVKRVRKIVRPTYYIRAIVPGRAYIERKGTHQSTTVKVNDRLPTYGTITRIDPVDGIVKTSVGIDITYGPLDS